MVDFRWRVASGGQLHPFEPDAIAALYAHSGGTPREVAILADNALLLTYLHKQTRVEGTTVELAARERRVNIVGADEETT